MREYSSSVTTDCYVNIQKVSEIKSIPDTAMFCLHKAKTSLFTHSRRLPEKDFVSCSWMLYCWLSWIFFKKLHTKPNVCFGTLLVNLGFNISNCNVIHQHCGDSLWDLNNCKSICSHNFPIAIHYHFNYVILVVKATAYCSFWTWAGNMHSICL